jgi:hypothetical protein
MSSLYSIIRYVPDPVAQEFVNIGIVTWDGDGIRCRFIDNWARVQSFGNEDIKFLRELSRNIEAAAARQLSLAGINEKPPLSIEALEKMIGTWGQSVQFAEPRGSTKDATALLADVAPLFLRSPRRRSERVRTRATAVKEAATILIDAVRQRRPPEEADKLVKTRELIAGRLEQHRLDVALANGHLMAGIQAISFEISESEHLEKEIIGAKWMLSDIRQAHGDVPMAVFAYPPRRGNPRPSYRDAVRTLGALGAAVLVTAADLSQWATERASAI